LSGDEEGARRRRHTALAGGNLAGHEVDGGGTDRVGKN
jgi:hypothetical protein